MDFKAKDWLELELTQSGGFTGLTRRAIITRAEAKQKLNEQALDAISTLCEQYTGKDDNRCAPYPDRQILTVQATSATAQWHATLDTDQLPPAISVLCAQLHWKPL